MTNRILLFLFLFSILLAPLCLAQEKSSPPPITLTKEEQLGLEVLRVKRENLQLRVQAINSQIQAEQARINEQHDDLVKGVFKAHGASDTGYQLNDVETVLVPVAQKSVAGKGEGKKVTVGKFDNK